MTTAASAETLEECQKGTVPGTRSAIAKTFGAAARRASANVLISVADDIGRLLSERSRDPNGIAETTTVERFTKIRKPQCRSPQARVTGFSGKTPFREGLRR